MNIKISIALLFIVFISNAQPQVLDRVIAIVGKNPLLLSEVETTLIQQKKKRNSKKILAAKYLKIYYFKNYYWHKLIEIVLQLQMQKLMVN